MKRIIKLIMIVAVVITAVLLVLLQFKYVHLNILFSYSGFHIMFYAPQGGVTRFTFYDELWGGAKINDINLKLIDFGSADYKITRMATAGDYFLRYYFDKDTLVSHSLIIDGVDTKTLVGLGHCSGGFEKITRDFCYIKDKKGIYFVKVDYQPGSTNLIAELLKLDTNSTNSADFTDLGMGYAIYGGNSYYLGQKMTENIDKESFEALFKDKYILADVGSFDRGKQFTTYAQDKFHLYYGSEVVGPAEPATCGLSAIQKLEANTNPDFLVGCNNVYYKGQKIKGIDPITFNFFPIENHNRASSAYVGIWQGQQSIYCGLSEVYNQEMAVGQTVITDVTPGELESQGRWLFRIYDRGAAKEVVRFECNKGELSNLVKSF